MRLTFTGGEPLWRRDVFDLAQRARGKGLTVALATNGTLIDETMADRIQGAGIQPVAVGLDGADRVTHDTFRGHSGAFDAAVRGLRYMRALGLSTQINTTVSNHNAHQLPEIMTLAESLGVDAFHIFLQVPVGCGLTISQDQTVKRAEFEMLQSWIRDLSHGVKMEVKAIMPDRSPGKGACFVSHCGEVFPFRSMPAAGNLRKQKFSEIWDGNETQPYV
jgi:MoaA/NifB/PqqE/SkfB family radical SAM enzyme